MNEQGPFRRRSGEQPPNTRVLVAGVGVLAVALFLLFVWPFSLLGGGGDDNGGDATGGAPASGLPDGYEALSIHFEDLGQPQDAEGPFALTMPLLEQVSDGRNIGLYTREDGRWIRVSPATLVSNGTAASGEVDEMPSNLAVLRVLSSVVQITGWLPAGANADVDALEVITTVNPVGLAPAPDGSIAGESRQVTGASVNVVPNVRAATPEENSSVDAILSTPALRDQHITALVQLALQNGNAGVEIDYGNVAAGRRADFTAFITALADELHEANRTLSVALPAPVRAGVNWDTGAYDWSQIVAQADIVKLRTERDPALFFQNASDVLEYLGNNNINLGKVSLVVGRESYESAPDGLTAMTLHQALGLAGEIEVRTASTITPNSSVVLVGRNIFLDDGASGLVWDEQARAVKFEYPGRGGMRTVYLENTLSLAFKLELASRFGLAGVSITDVSDTAGHAEYWAPLRDYGESGAIQPAAVNGTLLRPEWVAQAGEPQPEGKGNMVWTAPAQPGSYEIQLIVSDGVIRAARSINLEVQAPAPSN